jgi:hypothetical protein
MQKERVSVRASEHVLDLFAGLLGAGLGLIGLALTFELAVVSDDDSVQ